MTKLNKRSFVELARKYIDKDFQITEWQKTVMEHLSVDWAKGHSYTARTSRSRFPESLPLEKESTFASIVVDEAYNLQWKEIRGKLYNVLKAGKEPVFIIHDEPNN